MGVRTLHDCSSPVVVASEPLSHLRSLFVRDICTSEENSLLRQTAPVLGICL